MDTFTITVKLSDSRNAPIEGELIRVVAKTKTKNDYSFYFGPSSKDGSIEVSSCDLMNRANIILNDFQMDYASLEKQFDGEIVIIAVPKDRIQKILDYYYKNKKYLRYPSGYERMLIESLKQKQKDCVQISLEVSSTNIKVIIGNDPSSGTSNSTS